MPAGNPALLAEPSRDCPLCPRLHDFIAGWRQREPSWFNGPVPTFLPPEGDDAVRFLIVGLAPGLRGANRTGRPFTGDYAGDLLYATLIRFGFARGEFKARPDDGLQLIGTAITNAVRCVPPENKPVGAEINTCRRFPEADDRAVSKPSGRPDAWRASPTRRRCGHLAAASPRCRSSMAAVIRPAPFQLFSSYHCSRYNTNTGVLTEEMFVSVFKDVAEFLETRRCR